MPFRFKKYHGPEEHIPGMNKIKGIVRNANLTFNSQGQGKLFPWGTGLVAWETDEVFQTFENLVSWYLEFLKANY